MQLLARRRSVLCIALLACAASLAAPARADDPDALAQARRHFERGKALYEQHQYAGAIEEFKAGQVLAPRPQFLLNIGQAHRQLLHLDEARDYYRQFLAAAPADDPERGKVEKLVAEIDGALAARPSTTPAAEVVTAPPPPARRPFIARHWWIIPVSTVAVAGLAVGLYFALRPGDTACSDARYGCLDLAR